MKFLIDLIPWIVGLMLFSTIMASIGLLHSKLTAEVKETRKSVLIALNKLMQYNYKTIKNISPKTKSPPTINTGNEAPGTIYTPSKDMDKILSGDANEVFED